MKVLASTPFWKLNEVKSCPWLESSNDFPLYSGKLQLLPLASEAAPPGHASGLFILSGTSILPTTDHLLGFEPSSKTLVSQGLCTCAFLCLQYLCFILQFECLHISKPSFKFCSFLSQHLSLCKIIFCVLSFQFPPWVITAWSQGQILNLAPHSILNTWHSGGKQQCLLT